MNTIIITFAIIGWVALVIGMIPLSAFVFLVMWNNLGKYNIGGVPNGIKNRFIAATVFIVAFASWWSVFYFAPFSIIVGV